MSRSLLRRYVVSVGVAIAALPLELLLRPYIGANPFQVFLVAVVISGLYGGLFPALLTTALLSLLESVLVAQQIDALTAVPEVLPRFVLFLILASIVSFLIEARRAAVERGERLLALEQSARRDTQVERERSRDILETIQKGFAAFDSEWRYTYANNRAAQLARRSREELLGRSVWEVFPDAIGTKFDTELHRASADQVSVHFEQFDSAQGAWLEMNVYPSRDGVYVFFRDITERKRIEVAIRESEALKSAILEASLDGIITMDHEGIIREFNPAAESTFGYSREEAIGSALADLIVPPRLREAHREGLARYLATGESRVLGKRIEMPAMRKDGTEIPVELAIAPIATDGPPLFTAYLRDITERKIAEQSLAEQATDLERSNKELEQFAYVASHDLQEPLRMVASFAQLLARRYGGKLDAQADEFIEYIVGGASRMHQLINDLLAYSRVGRRGLKFAPTACEEVLGAALDNLRASIAESGAVISHGALPVVHADEVQLIQLFQNLIGNAIKFSRELPPRVHVEARAEDRRWTISVRDNGVGIAPEHLDRIFTIFQRLHSREEYPGTGIGLAVCKKIVERHGGRIWAESEPGQGSVFWVTLPAAAGVSRKAVPVRETARLL